MLNDVINYGVRIAIIAVGVLLATGVLAHSSSDPMIRVIGIIAILFGIYRIILYSRNRVKYKNNDKQTDHSIDSDEDNL